MRQSASEILVKTENYLDTLSNQLIEGLTQIIEGDWGISKSTTVDKVNLLEIEVFIDGYRIVLYPMGSSSTQLGCWNRTDSTKLTIPVYLTFHDTGDSLDLKRNKWVSEK